MPNTHFVHIIKVYEDYYYVFDPNGGYKNERKTKYTEFIVKK